MKHLIISYKSRNDLYGFSKTLKTHNIKHIIINTPRLIASSCMLSIKTDFSNYYTISHLLTNFKTGSFLGMFKFESSINGDEVVRLM